MVWFSYFNTYQFNDRWFLVSEIHERRFVNPGKQHQLVFRTNIHRVLGDGWDASAGFTYFLQSPHDPYSTSDLMVPELRPHIQVDHKQRLSKRLSLSHRYRVEYRFFRNTADGQLSGGFNTSIRFRYRFGVDFLLLTISDRPLKLKVSDEIHLQAGKNIISNPFDQNRIYAGLNYSLTEKLQLEAGYMNWFQQRSSGTAFYDRDILRLTVNHSIGTK